jgi:hypothetical protein
LNIDATRIENIARFVNHSCDGGNLSTKLIRSSGALFSHLCFFALKLKVIQNDEELTFSYGEIWKKSNGFAMLLQLPFFPCNIALRRHLKVETCKNIFYFIFLSFLCKECLSRCSKQSRDFTTVAIWVL